MRYAWVPVFGGVFTQRKFGGPSRNFSLSKKNCPPDLSATLKVVKHTPKMMEIDAAVIF